MNDTPKKILVVDDQSNWRKMLQTLFTLEGYSVQTVDTFEQAQEKIEESYENKDAYDLITLDLRLEDNDIFNVQGLELLKIVKAKQRSATVVVLTGYPESVRKEVLDTCGADEIICKVPAGKRFDTQAFVDKTKQLIFG